MANVIQTTQYLLDETLIRWINYLSFVKTSYRNFQDDFRNLPYATGQTINYRIDQRYSGGRGATMSPEAMVQIVRPLTIDQQFHVGVQFNQQELTFDRIMDKPYLDMYLNPAARKLANDVESFVAREKLVNIVNQASGTPGAGMSLAALLNTAAYMDELAIPRDGERYCGMSPYGQASLSSALSTVFNGTVNTGALMDGFLGELADLKLFSTVFLPRHISGAGQAGGAPPTGFSLGGVVTGGPVSSGTSLSLTSLVAASQVFNEGDIIEVADASEVWMVNPVTQEIIPSAAGGNQRAQFVVTADVISDGAGAATVPIAIAGGAIVVGGPRGNISAAIPNGAQMLLRSSFNQAVAYHKQAIVFAAPPMAMLKGGVEVTQSYSDMYKMSITNTIGANVINYTQIDRVDTIAGCTINPEYAVRICY